MIDDFITGDEFDPETVAVNEDYVADASASNDELVAAHIRRTKEVYSRVFIGGNPTDDDLDFLMKDLAHFARQDTLFFTNTRLQDVFIGRKQVLQRIVEYTSLDHDTLLKRYIETQA